MGGKHAPFDQGFREEVFAMEDSPPGIRIAIKDAAEIHRKNSKVWLHGTKIQCILRSA